MVAIRSAQVSQDIARILEEILFSSQYVLTAKLAPAGKRRYCLENSLADIMRLFAFIPKMVKRIKL